MQLATWNVNSLTVRLPQVLDWLAAHPVDALVLQETKCTDDKFPHEAIEAAGYTAVVNDSGPTAQSASGVGDCGPAPDGTQV